MKKFTKQSGLCFCLTCFILAAFTVCTGEEERSVAGKKVISVGFDMPYAEWFAKKVREIEATGVDGVALNFSRRYKDAKGNENDVRFWWVHSQPIKLEDIQHNIDALKATDFGRVKHNFLTMYVSNKDAFASPEQFFIWDSEKYDTSRYKPFWPGEPGTSQAWPEDAYQYFNTFKHNMVLAAKICRELGLDGFYIDQETYNRGQFNDAWPMEVFNESAQTLRARMRKNVAEVFRAVCEEYPEIQILLIPGGRYGAEFDHNDSLCMAFTDGILMGLGPKASVHDGQEKAYDLSLHKRFVALKKETREAGLKYSAVPDLYRKRMKYSFGIWLDHRSVSGGLGGWHLDPYLNHFTARDFGDALYNALYESDGYVWAYNAYAIMVAAEWRKDKKPNVNEAYLEAIRNCKKPRPLNRGRDPRGADKEPLPRAAASYKTAGDRFETAAPELELIAEIKDGWEIWFDTEDIGLWSLGLRFPGGEKKVDWQPIRVGEFWERQGHRYNGAAFYKVRFKVPEKYRGEKIYVVMGGIANKCLAYYNMWDWLGGVYEGTGMRVGAGPVLKFVAKDLKFGDEENFLGIYVRNPRGPGGIYKPVWLAMERKSTAK